MGRVTRRVEDIKSLGGVGYPGTVPVLVEISYVEGQKMVVPEGVAVDVGAVLPDGNGRCVTCRQ